MKPHRVQFLKNTNYCIHRANLSLIVQSLKEDTLLISVKGIMGDKEKQI